MENPNAHGVRLQRHHSMMHSTSSSSSSSSSSTLTLRRRSSILQNRLPMKSNPYVGSFRHAPPVVPVLSNNNKETTTTTTTTTATTGGTKNTTSKRSVTEPLGERWRSSTGLSFSPKLHIPVTLPMKSSPYIGWFRHSPPSRLCYRRHRNELKRHYSSLRWKEDDHRYHHDLLFMREHAKWKVGHLPLLHSTTKRPNVEQQQRHDLRTLAEMMMISGHLKGGGKEDGESSSPFQQPHHHHHQPYYYHMNNNNLQQQQQVWLESAAHGVFSAFRIVARLASGFAYDAQSIKYLSNDEETKHDDDNEDSVFDDDNDHGSHRSSDCDHSTATSSSSSSSSSSMSHALDLPTDLDLSGMDLPVDLEMSVSSLAEAYYAHQAAKDLDLMSHCSYYLGTDHHQLQQRGRLQQNNQQQQQQQQQQHHRLDYVITQLDIARMARNASRHLDVESIYNLPTTTYHSKKKNKTTTRNSASEAKTTTTATTTPIPTIYESEPPCKPVQPNKLIGKDAFEGFSWLIIPAAESEDDSEAEEGEAAGKDGDHNVTDINKASATHNESRHQEKLPATEEEGEEESDKEADDDDDDDDDDEEDVCVICFEHFSEGDRLRVLPCQHSFHMGCIDRWLSGSHSTLDCVTSGCPTCKKRPNVVVLAPGTTNNADHQNYDDDLAALNGSVPAWAFAQIGESLAAGSH